MQVIIILEIRCVKGLNKLQGIENAMIVYSLKYDKPVLIILHIAFTSIDQIEYQFIANYSCRKGD